MKKDSLNDAIGNIDIQYLEEYFDTKDALAAKKRSQKPKRIIVAAAAVLCASLIFTSLLIPVMQRPDEPIITETDSSEPFDNETDGNSESETETDGNSESKTETDGNSESEINTETDFETEVDTFEEETTTGTGYTPNEEGTQYTLRDLDQFIIEYDQYNKDQSNILYNSQTVAHILIPMLISEDFVFSMVESDASNVRYFFVPKDYTGTHFDYSVGIVIACSKEHGSFDIAVNQFGLTAENGTAVNHERNSVLIDNQGYRIMIDFPKNIHVNTADRVYEYFSFKSLTELISEKK